MASETTIGHIAACDSKPEILFVSPQLSSSACAGNSNRMFKPMPIDAQRFRANSISGAMKVKVPAVLAMLQFNHHRTRLNGAGPMARLCNAYEGSIASNSFRKVRVVAMTLLVFSKGEGRNPQLLEGHLFGQSLLTQSHSACSRKDSGTPRKCSNSLAMLNAEHG